MPLVLKSSEYQFRNIIPELNVLRCKKHENVLNNYIFNRKIIQDNKDSTECVILFHSNQ